MSDEQLIERIRSSLTAEVVDVEPPRDMMESIRGELSRRHRRPALFQRLRTPSLGGLVAALATCAAFAIAAAFIVLLGHRHPVRTTSAVSAHQLVAELAVLRRPQTADDRAISAADRHFIQENEGPLVPRLTRLVATVHGTKLFLFVTRPSDAIIPHQSPLWGPSLGDRVFVSDANLSALPVPVPADELRDPYLASSWYETASQKQYFLEIVPDGVKRVRVAFLPNGTVYARAVNNTVVALEPPGSNGNLRNVTWYGASGQVIPTVTFSSDKLRRQADAASIRALHATVRKQAATTPNRAAPALLHHFAVFAPATERPVSSHGITIEHPSLRSLPFTVLKYIDNPRALRAVVTSSGLRFSVDPGPLPTYKVLGARTAEPSQLTDICLRNFSVNPMGTCSDSLAPVLARGLWTAARLPDGTSVIYGIAPDTNQTITLRLRGGSTRTVPVVHGVVVTPAAGVSEILVRGVNGKTATVQAPKYTP